MIWGIVSDAHGNPMGLSLCLHELVRRGAQRLFFLGDAVGYLPLEAGVLQELIGFEAVCLAGNHEAMLRGDLELEPSRDVTYGLGAARRRLSARDRKLIDSWPYHRVLSANSRTILLVHGGPRDPLRQYIFADSDLSDIDSFGHRAIFIGQTHRPFVRSTGSTLLVNVGSCGLPRDIAGRAACALYDVDANEAEIIRVEFDASAVLKAAKGIAAVPEAVRRALIGDSLPV